MAGKPIRFGTWQLGQDWFGDPPYVPGPVLPRDRVTELLVAGWRSERFGWTLLDRTDAPLGPLDGVAPDGWSEDSIHHTIRGRAQATRVRTPGAADYDWTQHRVQPTWTLIDRQSGEQRVAPLGVYLAATPGERYTSSHVETDLVLYDKLLVLHRAKVTSTYGIPAGANVIAAVRALIVAAGETSMALTASDQTLAADKTWEVGTTYLQVINDLLETANYFSLWCDGSGQYRAQPYAAPADRPIAWDFRDNHEGIYLPDWTHEEDGFDVPNVVPIRGRADGDDEPLIAVARNDDPDSKWSTVHRGEITAEVEEHDATDQATLDAIARRRLSEQMQVTSTFSIEHLVIPLRANDAVLLASERHGIEARCVVTTTRLSMRAGGATMQTTLREVTT